MIKVFLTATFVCDLCGDVGSTTTESTLYDRIIPYHPKGWVDIEGITHCHNCFLKHADEIQRYDISYLDNYKKERAE
jgi:hypothetical protein